MLEIEYFYLVYFVYVYFGLVWFLEICVVYDVWLIYRFILFFLVVKV